MQSRKNTEIKTMIYAAKFISMLFRPAYYPLLCSCILFIFTPLSLLALEYKLLELGSMFVFTIAVPMLLTAVYRRSLRLHRQEMRHRMNRIVPYLIFIVCYTVYLYMMHSANVTYIQLSVIIVALFIQIICTITSLWWKVSVHAAGAGAIISAIAAYGAIFQFNPLFWMSIAIVVTGLVGTSRMILRQHNLSQILVGVVIGLICGFFGIIKGYLLFL